MNRVTIIDSGVANIASVRSAFQELGISTIVSASDRDIEKASHLVLPGVGSFSAGMDQLEAMGLVDSIRAYAAEGRPLLGICLGMQLLCDGSEEATEREGLGIISGRCRRLPDSVRVPQLGWNRVRPASPRDSVVPSGIASFANSYALFEAPTGWRFATTHYGKTFVSALGRGRILATQFHPELSGTYGLSLLKDWYHDDRSQGPGAPVSAVNNNNRNGFHRIIPCLDVKDGRVVKGIQFQKLRDAGDPAECARRYAHENADEIVMLDIGASPSGMDTHVDTVQRVRAAIQIPLTVGGGIRSVDDARRLLKAGADKISVNSAAVTRPSLIHELATEFGTQCVVLAIDARRKNDRWEVLTMGGRRTALPDAVNWASRGARLGAGEILLTSWDRDGTLDGTDEELIRAVSGKVTVPVIASGGIGTTDHARRAIIAGASAVLAASIFHDRMMDISSLKKSLASPSISLRQ